MYREDIDENQYFFFNVMLDEKGEPILGVGKCEKDHKNKKLKCNSQSHLNLMMTTVKLMSYVENDGVFHIDGTHGVVKNRFPLDVFAVTDMHGQLHPIAFMLTSYETEYDFDQFYSGLIDLAEMLNLSFDPTYIMQDATAASYNSAKKYFPNAIILMCFFHVMQNVNISI